MSCKENMISELHTKKWTWKIAVWITDMWHVNKHNGRQAIKMVFMDQTVCLLRFHTVMDYTHFSCFLALITFIVDSYKVQRLVPLFGNNCLLNLSHSCIVVLHMSFRTLRLLRIILNTKWVRFHFWFTWWKLLLLRRMNILRFLLMSMLLLDLLILLLG